MKFKSFVFASCFSLVSTVFASNHHMHAETAKSSNEMSKKAMIPGYCEIEIINNSYSDANVYGTFDDGSTMAFSIYRYDVPHYISLFYNGYCHANMFIQIYSNNYNIYSDYTAVGSTIRIVPYLKEQSKVQLLKK